MRAPLAALLLVLAVGCGLRERAPRDESTASWEGDAPGRASGPVTATWCRDVDALLLTLVAGDTGISLLLHPDSTGLAATYRVGVRADTGPRPRAVAGLRLYADRSVRGYGSLEGTARVEQDPRGLLATLSATVIEPVLDDTIPVTARLRAPVVDTQDACSRVDSTG